MGAQTARRARRRFTAEDRERLLAQFDRGGQSQYWFSLEHDLSEGLLACWNSNRRCRRVDPLSALRVIPVRVFSGHGDSRRSRSEAIRLRLDDRVSIEVSRDFDRIAHIAASCLGLGQAARRRRATSRGHGNRFVETHTDCSRLSSSIVRGTSLEYRASVSRTSSTNGEKPTAEPWVSVDDVAKHLRVAKDSVYRWIEHRALPANKIGRLWKFKLSRVDAWVEAGGTEADDTKGTDR